MDPARPVQTQVSADVVAGETVKVKVQLVADRSPVPYPTTLSYRGFMQLWAAIGQYEAEVLTNGTDLCDCYLQFTPDPDLKGMPIEGVWRSQVPDPGPPVDATYYWEVDLGGPADPSIDSGYCLSPCRDDVGLADDKPGLHTAYFQGPDAYVAVQQPFDLYLTLFYAKPQPDGWSFVAGNV